MSKHTDAIRIVRNYVDALTALMEVQGSEHPMHDAAVYGGGTLAEEIGLATNKLQDLESKV